MTGRAIARLAEAPSASVLRSLAQLSEHGVVDARPAGRANLYRLNREHLLAPVVLQLAGARRELLRRLSHDFDHWAVPAGHVAMFGSAARGDGGLASDIDLLVVRSDDVGREDQVWRRQLEDISEKVRRWTGNHAAIAELSAAELERIRIESRPIAHELSRDAITLVGERPNALASR